MKPKAYRKNVKRWKLGMKQLSKQFNREHSVNKKMLLSWARYILSVQKPVKPNKFKLGGIVLRPYE
jgi:hypothetical protein